MITLKTDLFKYKSLLMFIKKPLAHLRIAPFEIVFHRPPGTSPNLQLNLSQNSFHECTAEYYFDFPLNSLDKPSDLKSLFHSIILKAIFTWFLAIETAMFQIYSNFINTH